MWPETPVKEHSREIRTKKTFPVLVQLHLKSIRLTNRLVAKRSHCLSDARA